MDANGQIITLPGIIATINKEDKVFIPFDNILFAEDNPVDGVTDIFFKQEVDGTKRVSVREKISTLFSPEEAAKFSVEFGGAFMRGISEKIRVMKKLNGG